jgi:lysophospholipase L1-like esterase
MFEVYLALGDSMSIDFYPAQDSLAKRLSLREDIGAASLLYRNDDELFPEFIGKDLVAKFPGIHYKNLAIDGATCEDLLSNVRVDEWKIFSDKRVLVSLTLGGNDLLQAFRRAAGQSNGDLVSDFSKICKRYDEVLVLIQKRLPSSVVVLTTVYDPTDGTGIIPSANPLYQAVLPVEFLNQFNQHVVKCAEANSMPLADVHKHFSGHGATCGAVNDFWYWTPSPIEPGYLGASEIRRVWLDTLNRA